MHGRACVAVAGYGSVRRLAWAREGVMRWLRGKAVRARERERLPGEEALDYRRG
jgi:hypothetical protein